MFLEDFFVRFLEMHMKVLGVRRCFSRTTYPQPYCGLYMWVDLVYFPPRTRLMCVVVGWVARCIILLLIISKNKNLWLNLLELGKLRHSTWCLHQLGDISAGFQSLSWHAVREGSTPSLQSLTSVPEDAILLY